MLAAQATCSGGCVGGGSAVQCVCARAAPSRPRFTASHSSAGLR